jgi:Response regulator of the LytR/AlgR family
LLEPGATNGEEALNLIESQKPDVVLLDIRLPGLDGLQVAAKLCERELPPSVVFCVAPDEFSVQALQESGVSYVLKPVTADALRAALKEAHRPTASSWLHSPGLPRKPAVAHAVISVPEPEKALS